RPTTTSTARRALIMTLGYRRRRTSAQAAVALLEFLAGAARAWVVAPDLRRLTHVRRDGVRSRRRPHARIGLQCARPRLGRWRRLCQRRSVRMLELERPRVRRGRLDGLHVLG